MAGKDDGLFTGFANALDSDGNEVDAREVDAFVDESEEGKLRQERQTTPSSIVDFHTDDQSTDGAPAANVPGDAKQESPEDAKAAEGKEASGS